MNDEDRDTRFASSIRVLLADDQPEVLSALRLLLEQEDDLTVIGEATGADCLLEQARLLAPDLLIFDWELPEHKEAALLPNLRSEFPDLRIVALSGRPEVRNAALAAGADAFMCKSDPPESLLKILRPF